MWRVIRLLLWFFVIWLACLIGHWIDETVRFLTPYKSTTEAGCKYRASRGIRER